MFTLSYIHVENSVVEPQNIKYILFCGFGHNVHTLGTEEIMNEESLTVSTRFIGKT